MGPLASLRVIEFAGVGPGPMAAMLLADLGAEVIRIDRFDNPQLGVQFDADFDITSRGRTTVRLDLTKPSDVETALRFVEYADILMEGFRPGVMEKLGLGPEVCDARNPRLIYGRLTGYGQTGPLASRAGHDLNYLSLTGALHAIGVRGGPPIPPLNLVGDYAGGSLYFLLGILSAIIARAQTGRGQVVDAAIVDGVTSLMAVFHGMQQAGAWTDDRGCNILDSGAPFYDVYETADGKFVAVAPIEPKFFRLLIEHAEMDASYVAHQYDRTKWPELREALKARFRQKNRDEWCAMFADTDACVTPVLSIAEAADDPHIRARGLFETRNGVRQPTAVPRFSVSKSGELGAINASPLDALRVLDELDAHRAGCRQASASNPPSSLVHTL